MRRPGPQVGGGPALRWAAARPRSSASGGGSGASCCYGDTAALRRTRAGRPAERRQRPAGGRRVPRRKRRFWRSRWGNRKYRNNVFFYVSVSSFNKPLPFVRFSPQLVFITAELLFRLKYKDFLLIWKNSNGDKLRPPAPHLCFRMVKAGPMTPGGLGVQVVWWWDRKQMCVVTAALALEMKVADAAFVFVTLKGNTRIRLYNEAEDAPVKPHPPGHLVAHIITCSSENDYWRRDF